MYSGARDLPAARAVAAPVVGSSGQTSPLASHANPAVPEFASPAPRVDQQPSPERMNITTPPPHRPQSRGSPMKVIEEPTPATPSSPPATPPSSMSVDPAGSNQSEAGTSSGFIRTTTIPQVNAPTAEQATYKTQDFSINQQQKKKRRKRKSSRV